MTADAFKIREAVDADLDGLPDDHARAELRANPRGWRGVAATHRGRLVGFWGAKALPVRAQGEDLDLGVFSGCFLDPAYRAAGLHGAFVEMDEAFEAAFEGRGDGRFGGVVGRFAESDWWTLRRLRDFAPIRTEVDLFLEGRPAAPAAASVDVAVRADDARFAAWADPLVVDAVGVRRDGVLMRARERLLVPPRGGAAHGTQVVVRDGRVVAAALFDDATEGVVEIRDWCVPEGDVAAASALLAALFRSSARSFVAPVFARGPWHFFLQRAGFRVRPATWGGAAEPYLVGRAAHPRCEAERLAETWFACAADVCRRPLPPLLAEETVTTPPPAGTRSGSERHG